MRVPLDLAPGLQGDDTTFAAQGRWSDGSNVRFYEGRPQTIGGWESLTTTLLTGVCRTAFPFTDNSNDLTIGFGTHSKLQLWQGGALFDITPTLARPSAILGSAPLAVTNTSTSVVVTWAGHGMAVSDTFIMSGAVNTGGIVAANLNGTRTVTAVTTDTFTFTAGAAATSTTTGGGAAVVIAPQKAFTAGEIDGTGSSGYGTGAYGVGGYGLPSATDYFPRTWSFGAWGENMLASPRGGTIYTWDNNTAAVATPLDNAPRQVSYMLVAPNDGGYQVFALGCNQEADGVFNPMCIRHSSVRDNTEWNTDLDTTAREYVLTGGGRLVAGRMCGAYVLAWTNDSLFIGEFVGELDVPWSFTRVARNCGLLGPNAAAIVGQRAFWVSPDLQFYTYALGGQPEIVPCQVREDFSSNLAASQGDKVVASTNAKFSEVRFDYPDARDGTGLENSRYVALCVAGPDSGAWYRGQLARTAFVDSGPAQYPIGVTYGGNVYFHEKGNSADGGPFTWFITSADCYLDENFVMDVRGMWPDVFHQQGPVYVESFSRLYPQDSEVSSGAMTLGVGAQKVDFRQSGRLFRFKFSGNSAPTYARLGKFDTDAVRGGQR